jgi:hypothetical protein
MRSLKRDYVGISGTKIDRFPLNPGYSRVFPHNGFVKKVGSAKLPPVSRRGNVWAQQELLPTMQKCKSTQVVDFPLTASGWLRVDG